MIVDLRNVNYTSLPIHIELKIIFKQIKKIPTPFEAGIFYGSIPETPKRKKVQAFAWTFSIYLNIEA